MIIRRAIRGTAALLLVGAVATGAGLGMRARSEPPKPEGHSAAAADEHRYRVAFKDGATVEVIAVSTVPTGPHTWWKPDGTPLAEAPADTIETRLITQDDRAKARLILVRTSGIQTDDVFGWSPTRSAHYLAGQWPTKNDRLARELRYHEATFQPEPVVCDVHVRIAAGAWTTEVSQGVRDGESSATFVNGHRFCFGKARLYRADGRSLTAIAVAHNFLDQDRRLIAVDRDGKIHTGISSMPTDGKVPHWVIEQIDAEFRLPPDEIKEFQVQFRPYEEAEIKGIALKPRTDGK